VYTIFTGSLLASWLHHRIKVFRRQDMPCFVIDIFFSHFLSKPTPLSSSFFDFSFWFTQVYSSLFLPSPAQGFSVGTAFHGKDIMFSWSVYTGMVISISVILWCVTCVFASSGQKSVMLSCLAWQLMTSSLSFSSQVFRESWQFPRHLKWLGTCCMQSAH